MVAASRRSAALINQRNRTHQNCSLKHLAGMNRARVRGAGGDHRISDYLMCAIQVKDDKVLPGIVRQ